LEHKIYEGAQASTPKTVRQDPIKTKKDLLFPPKDHRSKLQQLHINKVEDLLSPRSQQTGNTGEISQYINKFDFEVQKNKSDPHGTGKKIFDPNQTYNRMSRDQGSPDIALIVKSQDNQAFKKNFDFNTQKYESNPSFNTGMPAHQFTPNGNLPTANKAQSFITVTPPYEIKHSTTFIQNQPASANVKGQNIFFGQIPKSEMKTSVDVSKLDESKGSIHSPRVFNKFVGSKKQI